MKRFLGIVVATVTLSAMLVGCGGSKEASFDVKSLGSELATEITYNDELMEIDTQTAGMFLNLGDVSVVNSSVYEGSGATAEEIVVLECESDEEAKKAETVLKERVAEQKESFADYVPQELTKLDAAVIKINGKYAVLSVSDDAKAATTIIEKYM